jgi:hypothetical protein
MAPFYFEHCATCGRQTKHWHHHPTDAPGGDCDECGNFTAAVPEDDVYWVAFTNAPDLSAELSVGQYHLSITQKADSEAAALEAALAWAVGVSQRVGLPPHGMRLSEDELRRDATVVTDREAFHGYVEAFNKRRQKRQQ